MKSVSFWNTEQSLDAA